MAAERRRFHLSQKLGEGAHGQVFLAELESVGGFRRKVVLKLLHPDVAHTTEAACRMRDEARILGRLAHRHIVTVIDLVRLDQRWAMVMDHLPGADLDRITRILTDRGERVPTPSALQAGVAVLSALNAAWTGDNGSGKPLRIVHRDIKPSNVLLTEDGEIKVLDFGVARVDMEGRESMTGQFRFGTERYMGPERLIGEEDTPAGDVYATAATVAELILGEPMGRSPVLTDRHAAMLVRVKERLTERLPDHPRSALVAESLVLALSAEPADRPIASELAATWREAARIMPGDGLELFAQSFFPSASELLSANHSPVDGTLEESVSIGQTTGLPFAEPAPPAHTAGLSTSAPMTRGTKLAAATGVVTLLVGAGLIALVGVGVGLTFYAMSPTGESLRFDQPTVDVDLDPSGVDAKPPKPIKVPVESDIFGVAPPSIKPRAPVPPTTTNLTDAPAERAQPSERSTPNNGSTRRAQPKPAQTTDKPAEPSVNIAAAMVVLPNASGLKVRCGDVEKSGTASVRLRNVPSGTCSVTASWLGDELTTEFELTRRAEIRCVVAQGSLTCSSS